MIILFMMIIWCIFTTIISLDIYINNDNIVCDDNLIYIYSYNFT